MRNSTPLSQIAASFVAMAILASAVQGQRPAASKPAAVVNGTPITVDELERALKQTGPTATPLTELQRKQMRQDALSLLVDDLLLEEFLRQNAPSVDPAQLNKHLRELEDGLKKQGKTLQSFCKETDQTEIQLRLTLLNMLRWNAYVNQRLGEDDIRRYYDQNKDFFDRASVRVSHIVLRTGGSATPQERQTAHAKLATLRQDLAAGKIEFAEAAKKFSQDSSAAAGGDIGFIPRKLAVDETFARVAFALKVGEVSDIVETSYGLHLIQCTDRRPGQPSEYEKIKDEVREFYIEEIRQELIATARKTARIEINLPQEKGDGGGPRTSGSVGVPIQGD
jgi:peptidyl-prolyl cis-trans isomerase C